MQNAPFQLADNCSYSSLCGSDLTLPTLSSEYVDRRGGGGGVGVGGGGKGGWGRGTSLLG